MLKNENKQLLQEIDVQKQNLHEVNQQLGDADQMLSLDKGKLRARDLRDEVDRLHKKKIDLEA